MGGDRRHGALVPGAAMAPAHAGPINAPNIQPFPLTVAGRPTRRPSCQGRAGGPGAGHHQQRRLHARSRRSRDAGVPGPPRTVPYRMREPAGPRPAAPRAPVTHWSGRQLAAALLPHAAHRFGEGQTRNARATSPARPLTAFVNKQQPPATTTEAPMSTKIAVNLPVKDLAAAARFVAELGLPPDNKLATKTMAAFIISDDIYVLLVDQSQFTATTKKEIPDTAATSEVIVQLQVDSRQRVDDLAGNAFAAGALPANEPNDQGFLYGRSFRDLDGHHWDVFCTGPP